MSCLSTAWGEIVCAREEFTPMPTEHWYPPEVFCTLDASGRDVSGRGRDAVVSGASRYKESLCFDGSPSAGIDLSAHANALGAADAVSFAAFLYSGDTRAKNSLVLFQAYDLLLEAYVQDSKVQFEGSVAGQKLFAMRCGPVVPDRWYHVVVYAGRAGAGIIVDGKKRGDAKAAVSLSGLDAVLVGSGSSICVSDVVVTTKVISTALASALSRGDHGYVVVPLMGQSNMVGRGHLVPGVDDDYRKLLNRVMQLPYDVNFDANGRPRQTPQVVTPATNPLDHISKVKGGSSGEARRSTGLWKTFAETVVARMPGQRRRVLMVPAAKGSTGFLPGDWNPGDPIYEAAVAMVKTAIGLHPWNTLPVVLWHQGGSDAKNPKLGKNLRDMLAAFERAIGVYDFHVILGGNRSNAKIVNPILKGFVASLGPRGHYVYTGDLTVRSDQPNHFDAPGLRIMGRRYAAEFLKVVGA